MREVDSEEMTWWLAYEKAYGIPDPYFIAGLICQTIASALGKSSSPADFVPYFAAATPVVEVGNEEFEIDQMQGYFDHVRRLWKQEDE